MEPIVIVVVVAVVLIGVSVAVRLRRGGEAATATPHRCVVCEGPIARTDHIAAMKENAVRDLLGRVPAEHPPAADPLGNARWLAHADCASDAGVDLREAGKVTGAPPPPSADPRERACPACGHHFRRPDIVITTEAVARKYGPNAEQCPRCNHLWDPGGPPRYTIRG